MIKKRRFSLNIYNILIVIVFIIIILMLCFFNINSNKKFRINVIKNNSNIVSFCDLDLIPGVESSYLIELFSYKNAQYDVKLKYTEINECELEEYLFVNIIIEDEIIYNGLVIDLVDDNFLSFNKKISKKTPLLINIIYYLDESVGNEAQNKEAMVDLMISVNQVEE